MTLIIGIKCSDGIVIGADSAMSNVSKTDDNLKGQKTIISQYSKIDVYENKVLFSAAGCEGLAESISRDIKKLYLESNNFNEYSLNDVLRYIRTYAWRNIELERDIKHAGLKQIQRSSKLKISEEITQKLNSIAVSINNYPYVSCLLAFPHKDIPQLVTIDSNTGQASAINKYNFIALGSGQNFAMPILGFFERILWSKNIPSIEEAMFVISWTIQLAINISAEKFSNPIDISVLSMTNNEWAAKMIGKKEQNTISKTILRFTKLIQSYRAPK